MISCQIALYPLETMEVDKVILDALEAVKPLIDDGLIVEVGTMSTVIKGEDTIVWEALQLLYYSASKNGQKIILNTQISNECGCSI